MNFHHLGTCSRTTIARSTSFWLIMNVIMPLILLAVTTCSFLIPASATTSAPSNILTHQSQSNQFNSLSKNSILKAPPLSAEKIASRSITPPPPSPPSSSSSNNTSTSLYNASTSTPTQEASITPTTAYKVQDELQSQSTTTLRGEHQSNIISRLLYSFASQLLDISSKRQLEVSDALPVPTHIKMDEQVPLLEGIYNRCKAKAHRHLETLKSSSSMMESSTSTTTNINGWIKKEGKRDRLKRKINNRIAKSESLILVKALLLHQKKNLAITGILRLTNTLIQAFPAILVSRLLKLIESGEMHHPSKAYMASVQLISLLSLKMIIENLYFHNVIKTATLVRGSLTGLIFDKSLRLSSSSFGGGIHTNSVNGDGDGDDDHATPKLKRKKREQNASLGTGGILNLMQTDVGVIESTAMQIHTIWDGLLQIGIYSFLLYRFLGASVFYGIGVLLLTIPTNSITLRILNRLAKYEFEAKDARTKKTTEAVSNMKLLKLQGWEKHFKKGIEIQRKEEIRRHINRGAFRALNNAISNAIPAIVLVVTLTAYRRTGKPIVASTIFTAISLFNQLRFPLLFYPMVVDSLANGKNSIRRLSRYLSQEELTPYIQRISKEPGEGGSIELKNGNFLWSSATTPDGDFKSVVAAPALCGAELTVNPGEIVAVVGSVGSGKTCLVKALLGELEPVPRMMIDETGSGINSSGSDVSIVKIKGKVAYCAQEAWLSKGTIRDAVLFGRDYDEEKYFTALYDSGLDEDFSIGTLSSNTQVGEGGASLSGGQRARVQLARALYDDEARVFLLDDPLSALDASVGSTVFERVTQKIRARNAAAIFVTNDASLPRRCDRVILMGSTGGSQSCSKIIDSGSYDYLLSKGFDLKSVSTDELNTENNAFNSTSTEIPIELTTTQHPDIDRQTMLEHQLECIPDGFQASKSSVSGGNSTIAKGSDAERKVMTNRTPVKKSGTIDEQMSTGAVPWKTYATYLKSIRNPLLVLVTLACFFTANGAQYFQQYTVAKWTELSQTATFSSALSIKYLQTLVHAAGVVSVFLWLRSYLLMRAGSRASEFLHDKMLHSVFNAPSTFFDSTPSGQILSRFGKELETVDRSVPDGIGSVLFCFLNIIMTVLGLAGAVTPRMVIPIAFVGIFYKVIMSQFRPAARDLKRCESKTRSPIYTHFGETLRGAETIRSFPGSSSKWSSNLRSLVDDNLLVFYSVKNLDRWLSIRLESLGNVIVLLAAVASIILTRNGLLKSGFAGWGLTQSLAITGLLTWAVRVLTDLESQMMSVMRVTELTNIESSENIEGVFPTEIPQEYENPGEALARLFSNQKIRLQNTPIQEKALIQSGWPWKGDILFNNVSMRYNSDSPLALNHVTLKVPAGTTLGIVGRTGSGKSSLLLTLFRLIEIEQSGEILVDGVDIRSIGLQTLRKTLSIIPQDPTLFSGTLFYNLDATGRSKREDAWLALEAASPDLANEFRQSGLGLDSIIEEGGKNYSAGQRQLICLARALLRRSKILVLDEATSSVDPITDSLVQQTIRREFVNKGVSVITVAHRLETVLGSDKIAVLGDGKLIEYGRPEELLRNKTGHLRRLVDADSMNKRKGASVK